MPKEIMCTLTAAQAADAELVAAMRDAGMQSVRINTAHLDDTAQLVAIAETLHSLGLRVLIDTKGPEMRTTDVAGGSVVLRAGDTVTVTGADHDTTAAEICVNYPGLPAEVAPGDLLLIDDGTIALRVAAIDGPRISAAVERGGALGSRKGMAVAGKDLALPAVSTRDRMFIACAAACPSIDVIAHSFVRSAADVAAVRQAMDGARKPLIAKIENQQGIDNLAEILDAADGVLIARGDLTASLGAERIPAAQQAIAAAAKAAGKPLYLATNILPSMMAPGATAPSAADREGIAVAVRQGVDVFLLTNETAAGANPLAATEGLAQALGARQNETLDKMRL